MTIRAEHRTGHPMTIRAEHRTGGAFGFCPVLDEGRKQDRTKNLILCSPLIWIQRILEKKKLIFVSMKKNGAP